MPENIGQNGVSIKQRNMESIKRILYRNAPLSRAEIAERVGLTPATVTNITSELIQQGVVRELPRNESTSSHSIGRRPIDIDFAADAKLALGIALARDLTYYCITDLRGNIIIQDSTDLAPDNYDEMVIFLLELLQKLRAQYHREWSKLLGIGVSMPGIVDCHTGALKNIDGERVTWIDRPLGVTISQAFQLPVRLDNNARARACCIQLFHPELLGTHTTFAFCHAAFGISCPIILENQSFRGEDAAAGEIGKMIVDFNGQIQSNYGVPGNLESLSSIGAIRDACIQALREKRAPILAKLCPDPSQLTFDQILTAQTSGDEDVKSILHKAMFFLGIALANVVDFMNPRLIFLSGPAFSVEENYQTVCKTMHTYAFRAGNQSVQLVNYDLGNYGGAIGAAAVCIEKFFLRG